jgi:tRNA (cytosine34-C5)-methyltransferase
MHLERCLRLYPQHQDTGGFFVAVLTKTGPLSNSEVHRLARTAVSCSELEKALLSFGNDTNLSSSILKTTEAAAASTDDIEGAVVGSEEAHEETAAPTEDADEVDPEAATLAAETGGFAKEGKVQRGDYASTYKEEPFCFAADQFEFMSSLREFYGVGDDFPLDQVLSRSVDKLNRHIYLVSREIRDVLMNNDIARLRVRTRRVYCNPSYLTWDPHF